MYEGIVTRRTLLEHLSVGGVRNLLDSHVLRRAFRGVYLRDNAADHATPAIMRRAALTYADLPDGASTSRAYLCCHSGAAEWELPVPPSGSISVGVPRARIVTAQPGLAVHRHSVGDVDIVERNGVRVVNRHLALVQAFGSLPSEQRRQLAIRSVQDRLVDVPRVRSVIARTTRHRKELLELLSLAESGSHSELEIAAMSRVLVAYGLATLFQRQFTPALPGRRVTMDFAAPAYRVNLETDGSRYHSRPAQRRADVRRDLDLGRHQWAVIRCQYENVMDEPDRVAAAIMSQLVQRGWTDAPSTTAGRLLRATLGLTAAG